MPEFKLPTIKLPGFRDMTTDDITQAISEVPRPNVRLADIADAAVAATQAAAKAAQEAAAAAQSAAQSAAERAPISPIRRQRSRRPLFIVGMVVAMLGLVALANADRIRPRLAEMSRRARERMDADRVSGSLERLGSDEEAYTGSVGIPVQADAYADTLPSAAPTETVPQSAGYGSSYGESNVYGERNAYGEGETVRKENPAEAYRG
jgi:hypothetical protein